MDCSMAELRAAKVRFGAVSLDWGLTPDEQAALLGLARPAEPDLTREELGVEAETRMRLLVEVAGALDDLLGPALLDWLRDDEDDQLSPLAFMSQGVAELRAMRAAAGARLCS